MDGNKQLDLIAQEYLQLQKVVEDFDLRAITIKAWSVTFSATGLGAAYLQGKPVLLLISALSALVFWIVEALWKTNQQAYYPRIKQIEQYFAGEKVGSPISPFAIKTAWGSAFRDEGGYWRAFKIMGWPHVALPHVVVIIAGLGLLALSELGGVFTVNGKAGDGGNVVEATPRPSEERL
jgi:hypothetical protein